MHDYRHGAMDPALEASERGIWAVKMSLLYLAATGAIQMVIAFLSGSIALLADTIHNLGDATTSLPLWGAFALARRRPSRRFTYGYGRVEDLAGLFIVLVILASAAAAAYESIQRLLNPRPFGLLWAVAVAALIGFAGNEAAARLRLRVGREIDSAALVADGRHARVDALTSLGVLASAGGAWLGYPLADPIVGLFITAAILRIVWESGKSVFLRLLDGVAPEVHDEIRHALAHVPGAKGVNEVRVRWLGHRLHAEVNLTVAPELSVVEGHEVALHARHQLLHHLPYLSGATIHVDPASSPGEEYHRIEKHAHGEFIPHSHR